jgi:hypothetical protein
MDARPLQSRSAIASAPRRIVIIPLFASHPAATLFSGDHRSFDASGSAKHDAGSDCSRGFMRDKNRTVLLNRFIAG